MKWFRRSATNRNLIGSVAAPSLWLSLCIAGLAAQELHAESQNVRALLSQFTATWNDEAWEPPKGRMAKYMRPLDDTGWKSRMTAFAQIAESGSAAAPDLLQALVSESTPVRALAAQLLGYCENGDAKHALAHALERDDSALVRLYAADSLGMLGGRDHVDLLRRLETTEENRDAKRHISYVLDRDGEPLDARIRDDLRQWNVKHLNVASLGQPAPDFELAALDGQRIRLSQFRGKMAVVIVFVYGDT